MSNPFIGEIRMFGGNFAPAGWALCKGDLVPIAENDALFTLLGTIYGGDGENTFALPDIRGRVPIHMGQGAGLTNRVIGEMAGVESVTLTTQQIPIHTHTMQCDTLGAESATPANSIHGTETAGNAAVYKVDVDIAPELIQPMPASAIGPVGGSQPHENRMPFVAVTFIISLFGIFPDFN
jgi:microcystin-dependent protein